MARTVSPLLNDNSPQLDGAKTKKVLVEYLYLDLQTCSRCMGTEQVLDEVLSTLTPALQLGGYEVDYRKIKMETPELAKQYQFQSSPTIRVNGCDICLAVQENSCDCCSDISGTAVDCRIFEYNGEKYEVPPKEMLAEAILQTVFALHQNACSCESEYELPGNLDIFYQGKSNKSSCDCGSSCC
jgi:hypothetical protein